MRASKRSAGSAEGSKQCSDPRRHAMRRRSACVRVGEWLGRRVTERGEGEGCGGVRGNRLGGVCHCCSTVQCRVPVQSASAESARVLVTSQSRS